jgi:glutathione peroxidase-family protein
VIVEIPANNSRPRTERTGKSDVCTSKFRVSFPMMASIGEGSDITPVSILTDKSVNPGTGGEIGWNYHQNSSRQGEMSPV